MKYSDQIIKAHKRYCDLMDKHSNGIEHLYGSECDNRQRAINRCVNNFEKACRQEGLNYITVNMDLLPTTIKIN